MTRIRKTWAQLATIAILATGAVMGLGTTAKADPPPGWKPGPNAFTLDLGNVQWVHKGWYSGVPGNWHTGWLNVEEDDDILTGGLVDWWCPAGAEPPDEGLHPGATGCTVRVFQGIEYIQWWDVARFNQKQDRLTIRGDYPTYDLDLNPTGTVNIDLVIQGQGAPEIRIDESQEYLEYSELFQTAHATGRVDGHGIGGAKTRQFNTSIGFWLDGWIRRN
jgi:hypothetical protein